MSKELTIMAIVALLIGGGGVGAYYVQKNADPVSTGVNTNINTGTEAKNTTSSNSQSSTVKDDDDDDEDEDIDDDNPTSGSGGAPTNTNTATTPTTPATPAAKSYTLAQVAIHKNSSSCWTAINGNVYDLTSFINQHPGGVAKIVPLCGIDGTATFTAQHGGQGNPETQLASLKIGVLAK